MRVEGGSGGRVMVVVVVVEEGCRVGSDSTRKRHVIFPLRYSNDVNLVTAGETKHQTWDYCRRYPNLGLFSFYGSNLGLFSANFPNKYYA